ncbi:hypothetical protein [Nonomuraea jiangxiensis]|uniref:hypothetical protein n=1 Tax=Nonomuraea jiangxiensis TaxID=633440 RepID=UPI0015A145A9|nr:hypothetical protein [Nonomuraea jiangxiensis]
MLDVVQEATRFQVEVRTPPSADLGELGSRQAHKDVAGAARSRRLLEHVRRRAT